jgi:hypothetical protein
MVRFLAHMRLQEPILARPKIARNTTRLDKEARPRSRAGLSPNEQSETTGGDTGPSDQKSNCTLILAYRAGTMVVGISHEPPGTNP